MTDATQSEANFEKGEFTNIAYIDFKEISTEHLSNIRTGKLPNIDELSNSIEEVGLFTPLTVRPVYSEDGETVNRYDLVDGFRRHAALSKLSKDGFDYDYENIPCVLMDGGSDLFTFMVQAVANLQREDTDPDDLSSYVTKAIEAGMSHGEVAAKLGKRIEFVMNLIKYSNGASDEIRKNLREDKITFKTAVEMIDLPEGQQKALNAIARSEKSKTKSKDKIDKAVKALKGDQVVEKPKSKDISEKLDLVKGILGDKELVGQLKDTDKDKLKAYAAFGDWVCGLKNDLAVPKKIADSWTKKNEETLAKDKAEKEAEKLQAAAAKAQERAEAAVVKAKEKAEAAAKAATAAAAA